jgi:hypothetical protein
MFQDVDVGSSGSSANGSRNSQRRIDVARPSGEEPAGIDSRYERLSRLHAQAVASHRIQHDVPASCRGTSEHLVSHAGREQRTPLRLTIRVEALPETCRFLEGITWLRTIVDGLIEHAPAAGASQHGRIAGKLRMAIRAPHEIEQPSGNHGVDEGRL